jgi:hypothetical protein
MSVENSPRGGPGPTESSCQFNLNTFDATIEGIKLHGGDNNESPYLTQNKVRNHIKVMSVQGSPKS